MNLKKYIIALLAIVVLTIPAESKKKKYEGGKPMISFTEQTHDFGIINRDKDFVTTEFEFTNTGNAPLVIFDVTAECGCTRPSYPKNPIAPGKTGKIKVNFIPKGYFGGFTKSVKVRSNASSKPKVLKISGRVNPN